MRKISLSIAVALVLTACSQPMDTVIPTTGPEQTKFIQDIIGKLGERDKAMLQAYLVRRALASSFDPAEGITPGTTVKEAIADQVAWFQKQAEHKAMEEQRVKDRQTARAAASVELGKTVKITYAGKEIEPSDDRKRHYSDMQLIYLDVENLSSKAIKGLQGELKFIDMFGALVAKMPLQITDAIEPGKKLEWTGGKEFNKFDKTEQAIRDLETGKYSTELILKTIVFSDGTKLESP